MITKMLPNSHIKNMIRAMRSPDINIKVVSDFKKGTVVATYGDKEVYRACRTGRTGTHWLVRHHRELFVIQ